MLTLLTHQPRVYYADLKKTQATNDLKERIISQMRPMTISKAFFVFHSLIRGAGGFIHW
jgi:hypothetical protein